MDDDASAVSTAAHVSLFLSSIPVLPSEKKKKRSGRSYGVGPGEMANVVVDTGAFVGALRVNK